MCIRDSILIADAGKAPGDIENNVCEKLKADKLPSMLVLNKIDLSLIHISRRRTRRPSR